MKHVALFALLGLAAGSASAAEMAAPEKAAVCVACHGEGGRSAIPTNPVLAGQYSNYLERALLDYKSGARKNPIMSAQAAGLSDKEIKELAKYFSAQKGDLYTPSAHGALKP